MPKIPVSKIHYLHMLFHFGTEFFQCAEILNRLRKADVLVRGKAALNEHYNDVESLTFEFCVGLAVGRLRTPEELVAALKPEEIKALREQWDAEVKNLAGIVWEKYQDTMNQRTKRHFALKIIETDTDERIGAKKMRAASFIGHADPKSVDALLASKKAQGGVYDLDARLLKPDVDPTVLARYVVPTIPVPPRKPRKKRR